MILENEITKFNNKGLELSDLCRYDEALIYYDKAIEIDQKRSDLWYNKGDALSNLAKYDEALCAFDKAIAIEPNRPDLWYKKGDALSNLAKYDEALSCYDKAIELDPNSVDAITRKGNLLSILGRYEEAIIHFEKAINLNSNYSFSWIGRGDAFFELGNYQESINSYDAVLVRDHDLPMAWILNDKGKSLSILGKNEEAIKFYELAIKSDKNNVESWIYKGIILKELNRPEEANKCFDHAREISSNYPFELAWKNIGETFLIKEKYDKSIKYFDEALKINPNNEELWQNKALALFKLGKLSESILMFDKALEIKPNYTEGFFYKGIALMDLQNYKEAITCFNKVLDIDQNNIYALINKGSSLEEIALEDSNKYSANYYLANICYDKAISIDPRLAIVWYQKGRVCYKLENYDEAIKYSSRAIELDENYSSPLVIKGKSFLAKGDYKKAKECFEKSLELNELELEALIQLGLIHSEYLFDAETTLKYVNRILEIDPNNTYAKANEAETLIKLKRYDEAIDICSNILEKIEGKEFKCIIKFLLLISYQMKTDKEKSIITFKDFIDFYNSNDLVIVRTTWDFSSLKKFLNENCFNSQMKFLLLTLTDLLQGRIEKKAFSFFYMRDYIKNKESEEKSLAKTIMDSIERIHGFLSR